MVHFTTETKDRAPCTQHHAHREVTEQKSSARFVLKAGIASLSTVTPRGFWYSQPEWATGLTDSQQTRCRPFSELSPHQRKRDM